MLIPNQVQANGDIVVWKFYVNRDVGSPCVVTANVPNFPGLTFQSITSSKAGVNYTVPNITWPTTFVNGESAEVNITYQVTNVALLPQILTVIVAFVCDTNAFNNTLSDTLNVLFIPPAGAAMDDAGCTCGNVGGNDTKCSSCTTQYVLAGGSEINLTVNSFDSVTGDYSVTLIDPTLPGSFQYDLWCINCADGNNYNVSGPALVTIQPLFSTFPTNNFIIENFSEPPGGNVVFLANVPHPSFMVAAYIDGVEQLQADFNVFGNTVTFSSPFTLGINQIGPNIDISIHYFI